MADEIKEMQVKESKDFKPDTAVAGDTFRTSDGKVFKLIAADPNELPEPQYWGLKYRDLNGRTWARLFNSPAEAEDFIAGNGYTQLALIELI